MGLDQVHSQCMLSYSYIVINEMQSYHYHIATIEGPLTDVTWLRVHCD